LEAREVGRMSAGEGKSISLLHVVNNSCLLPVFRLYCSSKNVEEYLSFWLEVREFVNSYAHVEEQGGEEERQAAEALYRKFFLKDSVMYIEVEDPIGPEMAAAMKAKKADRHSFDKAQRYTFDALELRALKPFLQSDAYNNFLKREKSLYQKAEEKRSKYDVKEIEMQFKRIQDAHGHLSNIYADFLKKISANDVVVQNVHALGERFEEYSKSLEKIGHADTTVLAHCLRKVGNIITTLDGLEARMNKKLKQAFEQRIQDTVKGNLTEAIAQKKKYEKSASDAKSPMTTETLAMLRETNNMVDHQTFKALVVLMREYLEFFEKGYSLMRELVPEVLQFRQHLASSREAARTPSS